MLFRSKEFEGWNKPTTHAKSYYDLPKQARAYIEFIEQFVVRDSPPYITHWNDC